MDILNNKMAADCEVSTESIRKFFTSKLSDTVATQLSLPLSEILPESNLSNIGLTSLDVIQISQRISELLSTKISAAILYGHKNIDSLVRYLISRYPTQTQAAFKEGVFCEQQTLNPGDKSKNQNREMVGDYIRSRQFGDNKKCKYLVLLSGSSDSEVKSFARKIATYIAQFNDSDYDVLMGLEIYFLFEHPKFHKRLAIVCEDLRSLKSSISSYLNDKQSNWWFSNGECAYKNIRLFANQDLSGDNMVRELFEKNRLESIAYLWANQINIEIQSHYLPEHIERFMPQVEKIRTELFNDSRLATALPSIASIKLDEITMPYNTSPERVAEAFFELEELCVYSTKYIFAAIRKKIGRSMAFTLDDLIGFFSSNVKHARLIGALADILVKSEILEKEGSVYRQAKSISVYDIERDVYNDKLTAFEKKHHEFNKHIDLLRASVAGALKILSGEKSAVEVLFPAMSMRLVEPVYRNNVLADYYNKVTSIFLDAMLEGLKYKTNGEKITIIEIGAGTGGTSATLFSTVQPYQNKIKYVYTDISAGFVQYGKNNYAGALPDIEFCTLDIERDPTKQNNELLGSADIVISANAIHATSNIMRSISNIRALLKPRGIVILNEVVKFQVYSTLTFGLLEGWWLYEDSEIRIPNSPLLSIKMWSDVFKSCGFCRIVSGNDSLKNQAMSFQDIVVAQLE